MVSLISIGVVAVMGGCGGGGGGGLPKSSPSYAGSNNPAVIDSTTALSFLELPGGIPDIISEIGLNAVWSSSIAIQGSSTGSVTYWVREEETISDTRNYWKDQMRITFDNYVDDGSGFEGVLEGEGVAYFEEREEETYTGVVLEVVGEQLTERDFQHMNFNDFYFRTIGQEEERSGWMTQEWFGENDGDVYPWEADFGADIAFADYEYNVFFAVLDATGSMAWDGSFTTYIAQGTICGEGELESDILGCVDVDWNIWWDIDSGGDPVPDYPVGGTMEVSTIEASAMFEFGSSDSNLTCFLLSIDADGNGSYAGTDDWDQVEICDEPWPGGAI